MWDKVKEVFKVVQMDNGSVYVCEKISVKRNACLYCKFSKAKNGGFNVCPMGMSECHRKIGRSWFVVKELGIGELSVLLGKEEPIIEMKVLAENTVEVNGVIYTKDTAHWESDSCFHCKIPKDKDDQCIVGEKCSELIGDSGTVDYWR